MRIYSRDSYADCDIALSTLRTGPFEVAVVPSVDNNGAFVYVSKSSYKPMVHELLAGLPGLTVTPLDAGATAKNEGVLRYGTTCDFSRVLDILRGAEQ